jgi:hypothetical protein
MRENLVRSVQSASIAAFLVLFGCVLVLVPAQQATGMGGR